jgi:hypothetical protein
MHEAICHNWTESAKHPPPMRRRSDNAVPIGMYNVHTTSLFAATIYCCSIETAKMKNERKKKAALS